jgi:hypothetical protein
MVRTVDGLGTFTEQLVVTEKQANTTLNYVAKFEVK